jgi:hypothetical protein
MASLRIGRRHERWKSWILVPVMVVGSGRGNGSGTGAANAFVGAYQRRGEIKKGLKVIARLWAKLWTIAWSPGGSRWSHRAWTIIFCGGDGGPEVLQVLQEVLQVLQEVLHVLQDLNWGVRVIGEKRELKIFNFNQNCYNSQKIPVLFVARNRPNSSKFSRLK